MSLPTLIKTWEFIPNFAIAATGTALGTNRTILKFWIDSMTTNANWVNASNGSVTPSGLATVDYSCDSVTAGTKGDAVNRIAAISNIVWAGTGVAHSWIVLTLYTGAQLLITFENAAVNGNVLTMYTSASIGFVGGTTLTRPTAVDERVIISNNTWGGITGSDASVKCHMWKSTDGQSWRFAVASAGQVHTMYVYGKAVQFNATAWPNSLTMAALATSLGSNVVTQTNLNATASFLGYGASALAMYLAGMAYNGSQANVSQTSANDLSGNWPFFGQELISATASNRGAHGYLSDVWYGSTTQASGSTTPTTGTQHQFAQIGSLILPWCQVAFQIS